MVRTAAQGPQFMSPPAHLPSATQDADARDVIDKDLNREAATISTAEARIRGLKKERNAHIPVSRLPTELITIIFLLIRDTAPGSSWRTLLGVCSSWRATCLRCSALWTKIKVGASHREWTRLLLDRAQLSPLTLAITLTPPQSWEEPPNQTHAHALPALRAIPRVRDLTLVFPQQLPVQPHRHWALCYLSVDAPVMQRLVVESLTLKRSSSVLDLPNSTCLAARAPMLKDLQLRNCRIPASLASTCMSLSRLSLHFSVDTPNGKRPTSLDFSACIGSLPCIEELTLASAIAPLPAGLIVEVPKLRVLNVTDRLPLLCDFISRLRPGRTLRTGLVVDLKCLVANGTQNVLSGVHTLASLFGSGYEDASSSTHPLRSIRLAYVTDNHNTFYLFQGWHDSSLGVVEPEPFVKITMIFDEQSPQWIGPLTVAIAESLPLTEVDAMHVEWLNPMAVEEWQTVLAAFPSIRTLSAYESPAAKMTGVLRLDALDSCQDGTFIPSGIPLLPALEYLTVDQVSLDTSYSCSPSGCQFWEDLLAFVELRQRSGRSLTHITLSRPRQPDNKMKQKIEAFGTRVRWGEDTVIDCPNKRFYERRAAKRKEARERWGTDEEECGF